MPSGRMQLSVVFASAALLVAGCSEPTNLPLRTPTSAQLGQSVTGLTVKATSPTQAPQDTTLDIQVSGSGFDSGSRADWLLDGKADPRVRTNSTRFVSSTSLIANVTIAVDAVPSSYDVVVSATSGKTGIGTDLFAVLPYEVLGTGAHGNALNVSGVVAGDGPSNASCSVPVVPIMWRADGAQEMLPLSSAGVTYCGAAAHAINKSGTILGNLFGGAPNASGIWTPSETGYVLVEIGPTSDGVHPVTRHGMNDANEVIGWEQASAKLYWWSSQTTGWQLMQSPPNASSCQTYRINNRGEIVGKCAFGGVPPFEGYYWASHTAAPVRLPRPAASGDVVPRDINDSGVIVGYLYGSNMALRWTPGPSAPDGSPTFTLDRLPDAGRGAVAFAIAADGTVAGDVYLKNGKPGPAYWPQGGSYKRLELSSSGSWGEAMDVVVRTDGRLVLTGTENNSYALRWVK